MVSWPSTERGGLTGHRVTFSPPLPSSALLFWRRFRLLVVESPRANDAYVSHDRSERNQIHSLYDSCHLKDRLVRTVRPGASLSKTRNIKPASGRETIKRASVNDTQWNSKTREAWMSFVLFFQTPRDFSHTIRFFLKMAFSTTGETIVVYYYYYFFF